MRWQALFLCVFCFGCMQSRQDQEAVVSMQLVNKNGFIETISNKERIDKLNNTDFLKPQPYEKVIRVFKKKADGKIPTVLTKYHENGQIAELLEVINSRAHGKYQSWHKNGKLHIEARVIEGEGDLTEKAKLSWLFDGLSKVYDTNEQIVAEIHYEKGILNGDSLYYHENGKLKKKLPYHNDVIHGREEIYNKQEELIGESFYHLGIKDGRSNFSGDKNHPAFEEYYKQGALLEATYYDFEGKAISSIEDGGGYKSVFNEGKLAYQQQYQSGYEEGEKKVFDHKGRVKNLYHIKEEQKHGKEWVYYTHETAPLPKLCIDWYKDEVHGQVKTWYSTGQLESQKEYVQNHKQGIAISWYETGEVMLVEEYEKDRLISGKYYKKIEKNPISRIIDGTGLATIYDKDGNFLKKIEYYKGSIVENER